MAVLKSKDEKNLVVTCKCGCDEAVRLQIDKEDYDYYCMVSFMNGNFYAEQYGCLQVFCKKIKKIWAIIRNKDYYYSDIIMTKDEFEEFKEYINSI